MPEISVIMGVYNQFNREVLLAAVKSILNQSFTDFEFIIYDDGSYPEAAELLKEVGQLDKRILLIGHAENHGLAFSLNACIHRARGKYIARMDADDISYPDRLQKQKDFLEKNREFSWVGCNIEVFDDGGIWGRRQMPEKPRESDYLKYSPYAHPTVMYRAEIFDSNHDYAASKETLRCEDYEIFMRFRQAGLRGANLQEYLFCYREDMDSYKKRTFTHRINEARCRYRNFRSMGILFPKGWLYILRPIAASLIPNKMLAWMKRRESLIPERGITDGVVGNERKAELCISNTAGCEPINRLRCSQ